MSSCFHDDDDSPLQFEIGRGISDVTGMSGRIGMFLTLGTNIEGQFAVILPIVHPVKTRTGLIVTILGTGIVNSVQRHHLQHLAKSFPYGLVHDDIHPTVNRTVQRVRYSNKVPQPR